MGCLSPSPMTRIGNNVKFEVLNFQFRRCQTRVCTKALASDNDQKIIKKSVGLFSGRNFFYISRKLIYWLRNALSWLEESNIDIYFRDLKGRDLEGACGWHPGQIESTLEGKKEMKGKLFISPTWQNKWLFCHVGQINKFSFFLYLLNSKLKLLDTECLNTRLLLLLHY